MYISDGRAQGLSQLLIGSREKPYTRPTNLRGGRGPHPSLSNPAAEACAWVVSGRLPHPGAGPGAHSLEGSRWRGPPSLRNHEWLRRRPLSCRLVATAGQSRTPCAREDAGPHGPVALRGGPQQHNTLATAREGLCRCSSPPDRPSHPGGSEGLLGGTRSGDLPRADSVSPQLVGGHSLAHRQGG